MIFVETRKNAILTFQGRGDGNTLLLIEAQRDTMAGPCHGRIRSWPWSDPSLMGLGDEGPGARRGPEAEGAAEGAEEGHEVRKKN